MSTARHRALREFQAALAAAQALLAERPAPGGAEGRSADGRSADGRSGGGRSGEGARLPVPLDPPEPGAVPLPGLVAQCRALLAEAAAQPPPIRCLHHLACTGGTLIARCLAALPNIRVLSEVDPLSEIGWPSNRFVPTDVVGLAHFASRPPDRAVRLEAFLAGLAVVHRDGRRHGMDLVVRGHAHSHFHAGPDIPDRPSLPELLAGLAPVRTVITVRHPVESLMGLRLSGWLHFHPATAEEYARRYHVFLDRHADLPRLRYEDFVADPEAGMAWLCTHLQLPHDPDFRQRLALMRLSGDSGRRGDVIAPRPPRPCPEDLRAEIAASDSFAALLARLGYDGV